MLIGAGGDGWWRLSQPVPMDHQGRASGVKAVGGSRDGTPIPMLLMSSDTTVRSWAPSPEELSVFGGVLLLGATSAARQGRGCGCAVAE